MELLEDDLAGWGSLMFCTFGVGGITKEAFSGEKSVDSEGDG